MSTSILDEINQDVGLNDAFFERVHEQFHTRDGYTVLVDIKRKFEEVGRYELFEYGYLDFLDKNYMEDWLDTYHILSDIPPLEVKNNDNEWGLDAFNSYPRTGIGSAKLFADKYRNKLKFVRELGLYFYYNGKVWVKDLNFVYASRLAKEFAQLTIYAANQIEDDDNRNAAIKYYSKYGEYTQREKLIKDARTVHIIDYADFDKDTYLYNCQNGTFNLRTGELQPHNADDLLTRISNVNYVKDAKSELWEKFVSDSMENDKQGIDLLQLQSGYCLDGSVAHECFFMMYGDKTRNGKGTYNSTMFRMHGDYAKTLPPEALSIKAFYGNTDAPNESIAALAGVRYVCVSEPGESLVLNSDLVKTLTGGDPVRARFLHQHAFEFFPQFKIVINTNFLPVILDTTIFDSDRLNLLYFSRHFSQEERDTRLKSKLAEPENISGIFNWCYEGYKKLEALGKFTMPDKSLKLFNQYRKDSDTTQLFVDECLAESVGARVSFQKVYNRYKDWTRDNGFGQCSKKTLEKRLRNKGLKIEDYGGSFKLFDYDLQRESSFI